MPTSFDLGHLMDTIKNMQALVKDGTTAYAALKDAYSRVHKIKDEGRDPTPEEWDTLNREVASLHQQLQT